MLRRWRRSGSRLLVSWLGHATAAFTLDIYSHVLPQVDAEAAELIASYGAA